MLGGDEQRGEPAGAAAHQHDAIRVAPALLHGVADAGGGVGDVTVAPAPGERLRVRAAVARSSRGSCGCSTAQPALRRATARAAFQSRAPGRSGRRARATSSGGGSRRSRRAGTAGRARSRCRVFHVTARGSTSGVASNPPTGPRATARRPDPFAASTTTCGGRHRARADADDAVRVPVEPAVPALRQLARRPRARRPRSRAGRSRPRCGTTRAACRRATTRTTAGRDPTPARRARASRASTGCASPPSRIGGPHDRPAVGVGHERERGRPSGEKRGWPTRDGVAAGDDLRRTGVVAHDDARRVPRHVGQVPLVPGEPRAVGRPGRDPTRSRRARRRCGHALPSSGTTAMSHASSRSIDERDLAARRDRGRERRGRRACSVRTTPPVARRSTSSRPSPPATTSSSSVAQRVAARRRRVSAVTITGGADAVGGRDDEVDAAVEARRPRPGGSRSGDQRGSATDRASGRPARA